MRLDTFVYDETDQEYHVHFDYAPARDGRTYGPPENCYPDEPAQIECVEFYWIPDERCSDTEELAPDQDGLWERFSGELYEIAAQMYKDVCESSAASAYEDDE